MAANWRLDTPSALTGAAELKADSAIRTGVRGIVDVLSNIGQVDSIVLVGMRCGRNILQDYGRVGAKQLIVTKLVGYTEVLDVLRSLISPSGSVLLFGSTTATAVNSGVVGDSQYWARTLAGRFLTMRGIVDGGHG